MTLPSTSHPAPAAGWRTLVAHPLVLPLITAATILTGYILLWEGGTSSAALLLVLGYAALTPLAILLAGRRRTLPRDGTAADAARDGRPPYGAALAVALAIFALYVVTLAPTTAMWDASEYIAVARILGLPHPPGNPMFVLLAHVAGLVPVPVEYAQRINLLAAFASATAAGFWFLVIDRALRTTIEVRWRRLAAAAAGTLAGATAFTVWNQSVVNEKVYTVSLAILALSSWLTLRWIDATGPAAGAAGTSGTGAVRGARNAARSGASAVDAADSAWPDRILILLAYLAGFGYGVHPAGFLPIPAIGLAVLLRRPGTILRWRLILTAVAAVGIGLTTFAFEPIRSAHLPAINEGMPTACEGGAPELGCTLSGETWRRLKSNIDREQYGGHPVMNRRAPFSGQLGMLALYFRWQWVRDLTGSAQGTQALMAALFFALGLVGGWTHWKRDRATFAYIGPLIFTLTLLLVFYLNFKYGASQALELGDTVDREVRDRDYFFVWTFSAWSIWVGVGLAALWRGAAHLLSRNAPERERQGWLATAPLLLIAIIPLTANWHDASRAGEIFTREWARDLLNSVEPYGIIVTNGDNDSFPLWYAQEVEGHRRDVTVALTPYLGLDWYARQMVKRHPDAYDAAKGPALYRTLVATRPTTPLWRMTPAELDRVPPYVELPQAQRFQAGKIEAIIPPQVLSRDQILVLRMIADNPGRPIYFSPGNYPQQLGLGPYLRLHGITLRLTDSASSAPPQSSLGVIIDEERTLALFNEVYQGGKAMVQQNEWSDPPSGQLPLLYSYVGQDVAQILARRGDTVGAQRVMVQSQKIAEIIRGVGGAR